MKKNVQILLFSAAILLTAANSAKAQSLIHYWNFNNFTAPMHTDTIHGIKADYSDLDAAKAQILYAEMPGTSLVYNTYVDSVIPSAVAPDWDTVNIRMGAAIGSALRVRNPSDSMYLLFYIPTTTFRNIVLKYGCEVSSITHGQLHQLFDYSVDSGMTWRTSGLSIPSDSAWLFFHLTTVSFTDSQVNNNPKMVFRIRFNGNDTGIKGNNRFDNVSVQGDSIGGTSVVHQIAPVSPSYTLYPNPVGDVLYINADIEAARSIAIYNTLGQKIYTGAYDAGKNISVNTSDLLTGVYFVNILDEATGKMNTMKFIKQ